MNLVDLNENLFKIDISIRTDLADPDKNGIPFFMVALHIALVYKTFDPVVQLDEHTEIRKSLYFALISIPFRNIGKITSRSQPVDQNIIYVIILHFLTPHTSVRAYCCDLVSVSSTLRVFGTALYNHQWAPEGKIYLLYIPSLPGGQSLNGTSIISRSSGATIGPVKADFASLICACASIYRELVWIRTSVRALRAVAASPA